MIKQITLSDELAQRKTKKKELLNRIDRIVPWGERKFGKCKKCEFKYACNSCIFADCDKLCSYDVEAGQWK